MRLNRALLTSIVANIALFCMLFGVLGLISHIHWHAAELPVYTIAGTVPGLFIGFALAAILFKKFWFTRALAVGIVAYGLLLSFVDLRFLIEQYHQPPMLMNLNLCLVGVALLCHKLIRGYRYINWLTALYGVVIGSYALINLWLPHPVLTSENNVFELSVFSILIVVVAVAIGIIDFLKGYNTRLIFQSTWLPMIVAQVITVGLWTYLSVTEVQNTYERGRVSIKQTGKAIDETLVRNQSELYHIVGRVERSSAKSQLADTRKEFLQLYQDNDMVDSVMLLQNGRAFWKTPSKALESYDHLLQKPYNRWLYQLSTRVDVAIDTQTKQPHVLMGLQLRNFIQPTFAIISYDAAHAMKQLPNSYFDVFTKVLILGKDAYISSDRNISSSEQAEALVKNAAILVLDSYQAVTGYPVPMYAVLSKPEALLTSVRLNQIVLFVGLVFAIVLAFAFLSNTRLREQKNEMRQLAIRDGVTALYRRAYLEQTIQRRLTSASDLGWVLFIDLDGFKPINDSLGITIGNKVLNVIAERLLALKPPHGMIARFSSDEFIMLTGPQHIMDVNPFCQQLLDAIRQRIEIDGFALHVTASIGVYQLDKQTTQATDAIQRADVAMTTAKSDGGNTFRFYSSDMARHYEQALILRNELQEALDNDDIEVFYQPILDAATGSISHVEALARWRKQGGSFISPGLFIPIAEQTGQIIQLSQYIMHKAISDIAGLPHQHNIGLAINLSIQQFSRSNVVSDIMRSIRQTGFNTAKLSVELTESVLIHDANMVKGVLNRFRNEGIKVAIDDFGTGYSNLTYLNQLPIDILKIDQSFSRAVDKADGHYPLLESVIGLAHSMEKTIVVEGIETAEQEQFFKQKGCELLQGFYYSKPVELQQLLKLLQTKH